MCVFGKKIKLVLLFCGLFVAFFKVNAQEVALKTNILYWGTTTPNIGIEVRLANRFTVDLQAAYNPWTFKDDKKMHFWLAQPELRYWFNNIYQKHFIGVHLHGAQYFGGFKEKRYNGYLAGGGVGYGYDWKLSPHWNLETQIGVGYVRLWYKESQRIPCDKCRIDANDNYWGLTKLSFSVSYMF